MKSLSQFLCVAALTAARLVSAHDCPESVITLTVGQIGALRINADVAESEATHYNMSINSNPAIAEVAPDNFDSFAYGEFLVRGVTPGTNDIVLEWSYAPHMASGFCVVRIIVVPPETDPRDVADDTTAAEAEEAGASSDPINTYTGELTLEELADLDLGGPMPVRFCRYYASGLNRQELVQTRVGMNWMDNYDIRLLESATNATVVFHGGKLISFNANGSEWNLATSARIPYAFRIAGDERLLLDPEKNWVYHFDSAGRLNSIEDTRGNALTLTYLAGQLVSISDGMGRTLTLTYSGFQRIASVSDGTRTVRFSYLGDYLNTVTDRAGGLTRYQYDNSKLRGGLLTAKIFPDGNSPTTQVYDEKGRVIEQSRAEGGKYSFGYIGLETTITNPVGQIQKHVHDAKGNLIEVTDEKGKTIHSQFDSFGRRSSETTRAGETFQWTFHPGSGELASAAMPGLPPITFERAERDFRGFKIYEVSRITYSDGAFELFEQDTNGNITSVTDRAGRKTSYSYDSKGRMLAMTNSAGGVILCEYNPDGTRHLLRSRTPDGAQRTTTYAYDSLKRLTSVELSDGKTILRTYNPLDLVLTLTDEDSGVTSYEYSGNGLLKKMTYPAGNTIRFLYDRMNDLTNVTDHAGHSVGRRYDAMGRLESLIDRNGNKQSFVYDELNHMTNYVDAAGQSWAYERDSEGRPVAQTDPLGHIRRFEYDAASRVRSISLPPEEFRIAPDAMGRPETLEFPPGRTNSLSYFADGQLKRVTLPGGVGSEYVLDDLGRVDTIKDPNGKSWRTIRDEFGRVKSFVDPLSRTTDFFLDARERVSGAAFPGQLGTLSNSFNGKGQISRQAYSDGTTIDFGYDANGRLTSGTGLLLSYDGQDNVIACNGLEIGRDSGGRMTSVTLGAGKVIQYAYDPRNLVTNITDWLGGVTTFEYDAAGRLTTIIRPNGIRTTYAYDNASRLTGIAEARTQTFASIELTRDPAGYLLSAKRTLPLEPLLSNRNVARTYDAASQIAGAGYDALGRMIGDSSRQFEWDLASRLKQYSDGATTVAFEYDAFGNLIAEIRNGSRREFVWNYALRLRSPAIIRDAGSDTTYLVHTPRGELVYSIDAGTNARRFYHFDELGNTVFLTDDAGAVTDSYAYSPYGALLGKNGNSSNPFMFGGKYSVMSYPSQEVVYMRRRWLDVRNARFLSRDPNWAESINPNEINPYSFSRANPLYYVDPHGLDARVNQTGVHTDISVDIWQGDEIVGTLTVSYAAKGYKGSFGGVGEAISTVLTGTQGEFSIDYRPGSVQATANPGSIANGTQIIIDGTREQDERLRLALAGILGGQGEYQFVGDGQALIRKLIFNSRKDKHQHLLMDALLDDWETYRAVSQSCNDFTDAMLDIYFGENWYLGPIFEGDGLTSELKDYLKSKTLSGSAADPNGIAPVTGSSRTR